jgi:hypothetical protein
MPEGTIGFVRSMLSACLAIATPSLLNRTSNDEGPADRRVDFGLRMDNPHPRSLLNRIVAAEGWHWHQGQKLACWHLLVRLPLISDVPAWQCCF